MGRVRVRSGGPKKKTGARDEKGKLVTQNDRGTPELLAKKIAITGSARDEMSTLGVLRGRGIIDEDQYDAGLHFERSYRAYIGRPTPVGGAFDLRTPGREELSEKQMERLKIRYWNCLASLSHISPHTFNLVRDVCLYERGAGIMGDVLAYNIRRVDGELVCSRPCGLSPDFRIRIGLLTAGLDALGEIPTSGLSKEAEAMIALIQSRQAASDGKRA